MNDTRLRWRDLPERGWWRDPDAFVELAGHHLYRYDEDKARRLIERCRELGGTTFVVSPDLAYMHTPGDSIRAYAYGFSLEADSTLPPNSVIRREVERARCRPER